MKPIRLAVVGASGRMGQRVLRLAAQDARFALTAVLGRPGGSGAQVPGVLVTDDAAQAFAAADVVVDFAAPVAVTTLLPKAIAAKVGYLVASTGLGAEDEAVIATAAKSIAVLQAANLSLGVNVMLELVELAAARLAGFDIEVSEIHHRFKKDAPSGTALALGRAAERGRPGLKKVLGRQGVTGEREANELGYAVMRGGDVAGEHTVFFFGDKERVELTHRATDADIFAKGALEASAFLAGRAPGRYSMRDVLQR